MTASFWSPHHKRDRDMWEWVQQRTIKVMKGVEYLRSEERNWKCSAWRREGSGRILPMCVNTSWGRVKKMEPGSSQWYPVKGQGAVDKQWKILFKVEKNFPYHETGQTMAQVAQRGYGIIILRDIQTQSGCGPQEPAPAHPALSRGLTWGDLQGNLSTSASLCLVS